MMEVSMYSSKFDPEKASSTALRVIDLVESARAGSEIDWSDLAGRFPEFETYELIDWARRAMSPAEAQRDVRDPWSRDRRILTRFIAELYAFEGNPFPLAALLNDEEPGSPAAKVWVERASELAECLPENGAFARSSARALIGLRALSK
jgi:hypothetical protein